MWFKKKPIPEPWATLKRLLLESPEQWTWSGHRLWFGSYGVRCDNCSLTVMHSYDFDVPCPYYIRRELRPLMDNVIGKIIQKPQELINAKS